MANGHLYTVRDIARELGLPESTVRYYRDAFAAFVPAVGTGRRRRYPTEAIPLLRLVAEGYAQNRPRVEIEQALTESLGGASSGSSLASLAPRSPVADPQRDELLATVLDGERERREVMWQMARELVRLGEAIERQHALLTRLADQMTRAGGAAEAAEAARPLPALAAASAAPAPAADGDSGAAAELEDLRRELARERELVERLRRSKLDIERRAAEAEARLGESAASPGRRGLLGRFLTRQGEP
jgi:DNA-binding transcriptional MerR regulator